MTGLDTDAPLAVLVVSHAWYGDQIGGSFRLASEFAEDLAAGGHRVAFVCAATDRDAPPRETIGGIELIRYAPPAESLPRSRKLRGHIEATANCVGDALSRARFDVINGHSPLQFAGAMRAAKPHADGAAVPSVYTVHSPFDDELTSNIAGGRLAWLKRRLAAAAGRWVERQNLADATLVHTISQYTLRTLAEKHGRSIREKALTAPGWVEVAPFREASAESVASLRGRLGPEWQTEDPIFFTLRRLERRMGIDTLVDAASMLRRQGRSFRVLIGGGGALEAELRRQIDAEGLGGTVRLLGRLPDRDIAASYAAADCFVLPTRALECFGLIVLEAYAAGTPVLASRAAAIPELAAPQGEDWLFDPGDAAGLAERMRRLLDGELPRTLDLPAFADRYARSRVFEMWLRTLRTACGGGAAASLRGDDAAIDQPAGV